MSSARDTRAAVISVYSQQLSSSFDAAKRNVTELVYSESSESIDYSKSSHLYMLAGMATKLANSFPLASI